MPLVPISRVHDGRHAARRPRSLAIVLAIALAVTLAPLAPAEAQALEVRTGNTQRVLTGLTHQTLDIRLDGRRIGGQLLRFRDRANLRLRPHLAGGTATGLRTMPQMIASEYARGAIAGVNGGYFIAAPSGNPNGLHVQDSRLISTHAIGLPSGNTQYRAALGIQQSGRIIGDKIALRLNLTVPDHGVTNEPIVDLNRVPMRSGPHIYDGNYGRAFPLPANHTAVRVTDLALATSGTVAGSITGRRTNGETATTDTVPAGGSVIVVSNGHRLASAPTGARVEISSAALSPGGFDLSHWDDLRGSIAGAGLLVKDGQVQPGTSHDDQGVSHARSRRARTAVGRLADDQTMMVTVDETSVGSGDGVTLFEMGRIMAALGAVEAVAIDGGGSTTMTVNGRVSNRPSDPTRSHSSALFVYAPLPPAPRTTTGACPSGRVPSAGFTDIAGNTHRVNIDCLAWWQVTEGVGDNRFDPTGTVTRQQMASFIARWLDDVATRGQGRALPATASNPFTDVRDGTAHTTAIARLNAAGVINGTSATTYNPEGEVSRAQTASLVARALAFSRDAALPDAPDTFIDDNHLERSHEPNIDRLAHLGVIGGVGGYNFAPDLPVSRAAMASLLMRGSDLLVAEGRVAPPA